VTHQARDPAERRNAWKAIGIFLLITVALSAVFDALMAKQGRMTLLMVTGVMWAPGIAAVLTCLYLRRSISSMPWSWGSWRWNWIAWALPIGYGLAMYVPVWVLGLGGSDFPNADTLSDWSSEITGTPETSLITGARRGDRLARLHDLGNAKGDAILGRRDYVRSDLGGLALARHIAHGLQRRRGQSGPADAAVYPQHRP
jgi:hypothetical protein